MAFISPPNTALSNHVENISEKIRLKNITEREMRYLHSFTLEKTIKKLKKVHEVVTSTTFNQYMILKFKTKSPDSCSF